MCSLQRTQAIFKQSGRSPMKSSASDSAVTESCEGLVKKLSDGEPESISGAHVINPIGIHA